MREWGGGGARRREKNERKKSGVLCALIAVCANSKETEKRAECFFTGAM